MARTYREIAIEEMLRTVEEAMSQAINWWGDLPPPMKEAIEQFRTQLGAAIDSVEFVKRALDRQVHETDRGKALADFCCAALCRLLAQSGHASYAPSMSASLIGRLGSSTFRPSAAAV